MDIEMFLNSRMDEIFTGLLQNNAEYALTYRRYEHLCELTDPVVCQRKDIEISGEECESFALYTPRARNARSRGMCSNPSARGSAISRGIATASRS